MESITNYQTVCAVDVSEFDAAINRRIVLGCQPYGTPYVLADRLCQAMVQLQIETDDTREYTHQPDRISSLSNRFPRLGATEIEITRR